MRLTAEQQDVLLEVCNVGMSKAAKQLSVLLNGPVKLGNLKIDIVDFKGSLWPDSVDVLSMVCQELTQDIAGYAVLFLKRDYSHLLLGQMLGKIPTRLSDEEIRSCEQEAMLEIGNVLISSCTTAIVDMLKKTVGLNPPTYSEGNVTELVNDIWMKKLEEGEDLIVIATTMSTASGDFTGRLLMRYVRSSDKVFRYGGEEFLIVSVVDKIEKAGLLAERIVEAMAKKTTHNNIKRKVTCSAGYSYFIGKKFDPRELVRQSDKALYLAKTSGRNRVCAYPACKVESELQHFDVLDKKFLDSLAGGDDLIKKSIYAAFLQENENTKVGLKKALDELDMDKIIFITHKLKSSANSVGAFRLGEYAMTLETFARDKNEEKVLSIKSSFQSLLDDTIIAISDIV